MPITKHYAGQGCKCCAQSESECNCDADWTDPEVYKLRAKVVELEARLVIDTLNPNRREHIVQLTSRIDAVMKHIEERYDSQEPWTTPEEVKAILRGGLWS
jgi:hypothetical protein